MKFDSLASTALAASALKYSINYVDELSAYGSGRIEKINNATCFIPYAQVNHTVLAPQLVEETISKASLIIENKFNKTCVSHQGGFWTYQVCPGNLVQQYNLDPVSKEVNLKYVLGRFDNSTEYTFVDNQVRTLVTHGDMCSEVDHHRTTEIIYTCDPSLFVPQILNLQEARICHYQVLVHVPELCSVLPQEETFEIECVSPRRTKNKRSISVSDFSPVFLGHNTYFIYNNQTSAFLVDGEPATCIKNAFPRFFWNGLWESEEDALMSVFTVNVYSKKGRYLTTLEITSYNGYMYENVVPYTKKSFYTHLFNISEIETWAQGAEYRQDRLKSFKLNPEETDSKDDEYEEEDDLQEEESHDTSDASAEEDTQEAVATLDNDHDDDDGDDVTDYETRTRYETVYVTVDLPTNQDPLETSDNVSSETPPTQDVLHDEL